MYGTKVATKEGWNPVQELSVGDQIRTLDNGFQMLRRVSTDCIVVPSDEARAECLPVRVPTNAAFNTRPVWLMPEQGLALDNSRFDNAPASLPVVPARLLSGMFRLTSDTPASYFDICTLFFDQDEVVYVEGGFRAYCPSGRFGTGNFPGNASYKVVGAEAAADLVNEASRSQDVSVLAHSLGAVPAPIFEHPIVPVRPVRGTRRPGRPGRPVAMI